MNGIPNLGKLKPSIARASPATGSFQVPPHYGGPPGEPIGRTDVGTKRFEATTLGQLRAIERENPRLAKSDLLAFADAQVVNGVFPSRIDPPSSVVQASAIDDASKDDSVGSGFSTGPVVRGDLKDDSDIKWVSP